MTQSGMIVRGTCVALETNGIFYAVLLRGPSGSGKSDLALRIMDMGGKLVSDDMTIVELSGKSLCVSAPKEIRGQIEIRGLGVIRLGAGECVSGVDLGLVVDLVERSDVPRMPEGDCENYFGIPVAKRKLYAFDASSALRISRMLGAVLHPERLVE